MPGIATAEDLVDRVFLRNAPNQLWLTDVTEHPTRKGKVYCAVVLDAFSRRVVGWSISHNPTAALTSNALGMAIEQRDAARGKTVIHCDHGTQFTAWAFTDRARRSGLVPSMGSIGDCYDNAMIEAFWSRMQVELLNTRRWKTRVELANAIFEYIEIFHNRRRRHSALGMRTPIEYELLNNNHTSGRLNPETRLHRTGGTATGPRKRGASTLGRRTHGARMGRDPPKTPWNSVEASSAGTRKVPVTPEVAGSSPSLPLKEALETGPFLSGRLSAARRG